MSPDLRDVASGRSVETVKAIARAGYDVVGDLDELLAPATSPAGGTAADRLTGPELLEVAVPAIVGCVRELKGLVPARAGVAGRERAGAPPTAAVGESHSRPAGSRRTVFVHIRAGQDRHHSPAVDDEPEPRAAQGRRPVPRWEVRRAFLRRPRCHADAVSQSQVRTDRGCVGGHRTRGAGLGRTGADLPRSARHRVEGSGSADRRLPARGRVHVVITARDLARQLPAVWQERLKVGHDLTWATFLSAVKDSDRGTDGTGAGRPRCRQDRAGLLARPQPHRGGRPVGGRRARRPDPRRHGAQRRCRPGPAGSGTPTPSAWIPIGMSSRTGVRTSPSARRRPSCCVVPIPG